MNERDFIEKLSRMMPRSPLQMNKTFESDSEIVEFGGEKLFFSIDEFSAEDMFIEKDPYILGYNIAAAAISDIYASGGVPVYYAHSLTINEMFTDQYLERFYTGVSEVLEKTGTAFIGGDFGKAGEWRCCTSVIGAEGKPVLRSGAKIGDLIYITGEIGAGNIQAAAKMYRAPIAKTRFHIRDKEAALIRKHASACIDTSDGAFSAASAIADMSGVGFEIDTLAYHKAGAVLSKMLGLPKELLFLCECGEYELLFTIPKNKKEEFEKEAKERNLTFYQIGCVTTTDIKRLHDKSKTIDLGAFDLSARSFSDLRQYIGQIIQYLTK